MELEPGNPNFEPIIDRRTRIEDPLPVRLVTVADAVLPAIAGLEPQLDNFYINLFGFQRDPNKTHDIVYIAENFNLHFQLLELPPDRDSMRPLGIEIESLSALEHKLIEQEIEYLRQRGTTLAHYSLLLTDPAGNWLEVFEPRPI